MKTHQSMRGRAFVDGIFRDDVLVVMRDGRFVEVSSDAGEAERILDEDHVMLPGLIDLHVHGGDGSDFMDGSETAFRKVTAFHARGGTTSLAATTLSGSSETILTAVRTAAEASRTSHPGCAEIVAVHLEGPFISRTKAGAQDLGSIRPPALAEMASIVEAAGHLSCIMTIAPELPGARLLIEAFRDRVLFSIGHSEATYGEAVDAMGLGARHFTHLFNAMTPLHHREPGVAGAALLSLTETAEIIADGVHVHPAVLRLAARTMPGRLALVTDAMRACGMDDGHYKLYEHDVEVSGGVARLRDGTLAGSLLTMNRALQNMVELAGLPLESVIPLATEVPARIVGVDGRKGKIAVGYDADLVVLDSKFQIDSVYLRGEELRGVRGAG